MENTEGTEDGVRFFHFSKWLDIYTIVLTPPFIANYAKKS